MSFPRYPRYKDSGVEWLGEVPAHWNVSTVKRVFSSLDGRRVPLSAEERGGRKGEYPYYGASGVIDFVDDYIFDEDLVLVSEDGANLLNRSTPIAFVATGRYWVNNHAHILRPPDKHAVFWAEAIERADLAPVVTGAAQPKLTAEALGNTPVVFPPSGEERATIEAFIVAQSARLDALLAEQQRLIELLNEKRQAVISHAVTKGLSPAAPMKDSGVDWVGTVPAHWECVRNKVVFCEIDDRSEDAAGELLTVSHITGVTRRSDKDVNMFMAETLEGYKKCTRDDLVINTMWAWMGALGCSPLDGLVSPSYNVYRPRHPDRLHSTYYDYLCRLPSHTIAMKARSTGVWESRLRLYPDSFLNMRMPLPPRREQEQIVAYLDEQRRRWDALVEEAERGIALLQERRTALISAAVTGQIDVRDAATRSAA